MPLLATSNRSRSAIPIGLLISPSVRRDQSHIRYPHPLAGRLVPVGLGTTTSPLGSNLQIASLAATGAQTTVGILVALGTVGGPVGAAISAGIGVALAIASFFKGCGQTCIQASNDVNQLEPYLKQNLQAYLSSPIRTQSMQAAALNTFDSVWNTLIQACSQSALGQAGVNCLADRQSGACHYQTSPGGWTQNSDGTCTYTYPGAEGSGSTCWNWYVGYRDPIANDPCVQPDSILQTAVNGTAGTTSNGVLTSSTNPTTSGGNSNSLPVPLIIGVGVGLLLILAVSN